MAERSEELVPLKRVKCKNETLMVKNGRVFCTLELFLELELTFTLSKRHMAVRYLLYVLLYIESLIVL